MKKELIRKYASNISEHFRCISWSNDNQTPSKIEDTFEVLTTDGKILSISVKILEESLLDKMGKKDLEKAKSLVKIVSSESVISKVLFDRIKITGTICCSWDGELWIDDAQIDWIDDNIKTDLDKKTVLNVLKDHIQERYVCEDFSNLLRFTPEFKKAKKELPKAYKELSDLANKLNVKLEMLIDYISGLENEN